MGVEWDETLYAGSARYYARGRMPYPPEAADVLRDALGLDGTGRLLDVGCGPGSFTLVAAPLFEAAVGVDADPDMLAAAAAEGRAAGARNVSWLRLRAEDLAGAGLGRFRVVTLAQSFHWFDRPRVAAAIRDLLEPGGGCVHVQAATQRGAEGTDPLPHPRPPRAAIGALVRRYLGDVRRAGRTLLPDGTPDGEDDVLRAAGLAGPQWFPVPSGQVLTRTEDDVVASVFSLSSAAPHLFGDRLAAFEADLRALLRGTAPEAVFSERFPAISLDLYRAPQAGTA